MAPKSFKKSLNVINSGRACKRSAPRFSNWLTGSSTTPTGSGY